MKRLKFIKNTSVSPIIINGITINANTKVDLSSHSTSFKSIQGFNDIIKYFTSGSLSVFDLNNNIMSNDEFLEYYNYFTNKFLNHSEYYKIYEFITPDSNSKYVDFSLTPKSVDYIKDVDIRFARKESFTNGFLTNVEYFESSSAGADGNLLFANRVLNVNIKYYINSIGYVTYRETSRKWVKNDGTYSNDVKTSVKIYNGLLSREEAVQRRNNVINQVVIDIVNITYMANHLTKTFDEVQLMVMPLMDVLEDSINKYIKGNLQPLILGLTTASIITYPWLNIEVSAGVTLQDYIEAQLVGSILSAGVYTSTEPS